jgi:hypothetical protein
MEDSGCIRHGLPDPDPESGCRQDISDLPGGQVIDPPLLRYGIPDRPIMEGAGYIGYGFPGPDPESGYWQEVSDLPGGHATR